MCNKEIIKYPIIIHPRRYTTFKTVVLKNRKLHCKPILQIFNDNEQLHNKIICSVNLHILASN